MSKNETEKQVPIGPYKTVSTHMSFKILGQGTFTHQSQRKCRYSLWQCQYRSLFSYT